MLKKLDKLGLVRHERYHGATLTPSGERIALEVVRHHRLLELYLMEALGLSWDEVHTEAERLEHHLSEELEARIDAALGYPTRDPHGDPIPTADLVLVDQERVLLCDVAAGDQAVVRRVPDSDAELLRYLAEPRADARARAGGGRAGAVRRAGDGRGGRRATRDRSQRRGAD